MSIQKFRYLYSINFLRTHFLATHGRLIILLLTYNIIWRIITVSRIMSEGWFLVQESTGFQGHLFDQRGKSFVIRSATMLQNITDCIGRWIYWVRRTVEIYATEFNLHLWRGWPRRGCGNLCPQRINNQLFIISTIVARQRETRCSRTNNSHLSVLVRAGESWLFVKDFFWRVETCQKEMSALLWATLCRNYVDGFAMTVWMDLRPI